MNTTRRFSPNTPNFFHYNPFVLILTALEFDHADIYKNFEEIASVFAEAAAKVPSDGLIIAPAEDRGAQEVLKRAKPRARLLTYGENQGDFQLKHWTAEGMKSRFVCKDRSDRKDFSVSLNLPGRHNSLNALAVFAALKSLGRPVPKNFKRLFFFSRRPPPNGNHRGDKRRPVDAGFRPSSFSRSKNN